ncbi:MAG: type II toxin-antitoxin system HigB family toxin [Desulfatibacillum sp.]|nr:type II toxin-antitoxin system HigB family toxin [Desulfatibacillum sp.]
MHVISRRTLKAFYENREYQDAKGPLESWFYETKNAEWSSPADIKAQFGSASILRNGRVVFNIAGNKYRLIVSINYDYKKVYVKFVGTHKQYDKINAEAV